MTLMEKLYWLTDKYEGVGIPYCVIARFARCDPTTIGNYMAKKSKPTRRMEVLLEEGLDKMIKVIIETMGDKHE